jgi:hypothetical protein
MSRFDPPLDEREKFGIPVESVRNVNIDEYESGQSKTPAVKRVERRCESSEKSNVW